MLRRHAGATMGHHGPRPPGDYQTYVQVAQKHALDNNGNRELGGVKGRLLEGQPTAKDNQFGVGSTRDSLGLATKENSPRQWHLQINS